MENKGLNAAFILLSVPPPIPGTEKVEYAIVRTQSVLFNNQIEIITSSKKQEVSTTAAEVHQSLLKQVEEMCQKGWEVYNSCEVRDTLAYTTFFLKRKVKQ